MNGGVSTKENYFDLVLEKFSKKKNQEILEKSRSKIHMKQGDSAYICDFGLSFKSFNLVLCTGRVTSMTCSTCTWLEI